MEKREFKVKKTKQNPPEEIVTEKMMRDAIATLADLGESDAVKDAKAEFKKLFPNGQPDKKDILQALGDVGIITDGIDLSTPKALVYSLPPELKDLLGDNFLAMLDSEQTPDEHKPREGLRLKKE